MTQRVNAFVVILEQDIRVDDMEATINAIKQIRGVLDGQAHTSNVSDQIAETRAKSRVTSILLQLLKRPLDEAETMLL